MVWNLASWGRPFRLVSPLLDCSSPETTPVQIECCYRFSAVLTGSGDVCVWWPCWDAIGDWYYDAMEESDENESTKAIVPEGGRVIPCHTLEIHEDPVKLPALPDLPELPGTGLSEEERGKETKLIKIAVFRFRLIGLTNKGHVLKMDDLWTANSVWCYVSESALAVWRAFLNCDAQLPNYSEIDKVKEHPVFRAITGDDGHERPPQVELLSDTMLITHVSYIASMSSQCRV